MFIINVFLFIVVDLHMMRFKNKKRGFLVIALVSVAIFLVLISIVLFKTKLISFEEEISYFSPGETAGSQFVILMDPSFIENEGDFSEQRFITSQKKILFDLKVFDLAQVEKVKNLLEKEGFVTEITNDKTLALEFESDGQREIIVSNKKIDINERKGNYIVEFNEAPVLKKSLEVDKDLQIEELTEQVADGVSGAKDVLDARLLEKENILDAYKENLESKSVQIQNRFEDDLDVVVDDVFVDVFNGVSLENVNAENLEEIKEDPDVKAVYPDKIVTVNLMDSVPLIQADKVWNLLDANGTNITGEGITIAIIDTGVDYTHPDLGGCFGVGCKVVGGYDIVNDDSDPIDDQGHGTHVAATAAGKKFSALSNDTLNGVAPDADILAYKVLGSGGSGSFSDVIAGIERAVNDSADIISMSLGATCGIYTVNCGPDDPVSSAVDTAVDAGVIAVIAAGNSGPWLETIGSPGTARKAITVGASDKIDSLAGFSSRGPVVWLNGSLIKPDILAPGVQICAAQWDNAWEDRECLNGNHIAISGTSMATPHVAGMAALLKQKWPTLSVSEIKSLIMTSSIDLGYSAVEQGHGRVDAWRAANSKILISGDLSFGRFQQGVTNATKNLSVKNIANTSLNVNIYVGNATSLEQPTLQINSLSLSSSSATLSPGQTSVFQANVNFPLPYDGMFIGKIIVSDGADNHTVLYSFSRYSDVLLQVQGNHYPNFLIHANNLDSFKSAYQGSEVLGNSGVVSIRAGNYTAHAISDFVNPVNPLFWPETDEYFLADTLLVPVDSVVSKVFTLSGVKLFSMPTRSFGGEELELHEWRRGLAVYKNSFFGCSSYSINESYCVNNTGNLSCGWRASNGYCYDKSFSSSWTTDAFGDRVVYVSNAPGNGLDTDVILKYMGSPEENE